MTGGTGDPHQQPRLRLQLLGAELALRMAVIEQSDEADRLREALREVYARLDRLRPPDAADIDPAAPPGTARG